MAAAQDDIPAAVPYGKLIAYSLAMMHAYTLMSKINRRMFEGTECVDTDNLKERIDLLRRFIHHLDAANQLAEQINEQNQFYAFPRYKLQAGKMTRSKADYME